MNEAFSNIVLNSKHERHEFQNNMLRLNEFHLNMVQKNTFYEVEADS